MQRNTCDLAVGHSVVLKGKFAVGKHELGVILLGALDTPGRVNEHNIKFANLLSKKLPVEVSNITVDEALTQNPSSTFLGIIHQL